MVIKYSYKNDKDKILSKHFKVYEFRSHYNGNITTDDILINTILIEKLEELMQVIKSNTAIVTSGYRDIKCDKLVGGTGKGQHVNGNAADIIFYDINNKPIDTKYISCIAQDLGFTGIARISDKSIHLDVRTNGKYYGDETKGTNSVTNDFYKYYNIKKENDDIESAIHTLINKGIIADGDYWIEHYSDVKYLKDLIVKFANYIK